MDSNTSASCRIPNHHSLLLHISTQKAYYKQYPQEWALHLNNKRFSMTKVTKKDLGCGVTINNPVKIGISYIEYTRD